MLTRDQIKQLFTRWYKPIRQWLSNSSDPRMKAGGGVIDDLAQEVFVRLLKYRTSEDDAEALPDIDNMQGYLFRMASNVRNEWLERSVIRQMHSAALLDDLIEDDENEPQNAREAQDVQETLERCMYQLTPRMVTVLKLHIYEGLTYKQIATHERLTYRTVLRDLTRAYTRLRELMPSAAGDINTPVAPHVMRLREIEKARRGERVAPREEQKSRPALRVDSRLTRPELTAEKVIAALELNDYTMTRASAALGMVNQTLHCRIRALIPDFHERKAAWKRGAEERRLTALRIALLRKRQQQRLKREAAEIAAVERQAAAAAPAEPVPPAHSVESAAEILITLEANDFNVAATAKQLGVYVNTLHYRLRRDIPDYIARREAWEKKRHAEVLSALEAHGYSYAATAKALGVDDDCLKRRLRETVPDIEERKRKWKDQRREEVKRAKIENECARRRAATVARREAAQAQAEHTCVVTFCGVAQHALLRALEATDFSWKDAGLKLNITEAKARRIAPQLVPDWQERRERAREALSARQRAALTATLEAHQYNMVKVARALEMNSTTLQSHVRKYLPEYPTLRREYLKAHSLGRCGAVLETPEEHEARVTRAFENRLSGLREGNRKRWDDGGARHAAKLAQLQELENTRDEMVTRHKKEIADMRKAQENLQRLYLSMRERQVAERKALNTRIAHTRIAIPGYREGLKLDEVRKQREAEGHARKMQVMDACGGDIKKAAEILGFHHTHLRKWKRLNWQPPEQRGEESHAESAAAAG